MKFKNEVLRQRVHDFVKANYRPLSAVIGGSDYSAWRLYPSYGPDMCLGFDYNCAGLENVYIQMVINLLCHKLKHNYYYQDTTKLPRAKHSFVDVLDYICACSGDVRKTDETPAASFVRNIALTLGDIEEGELKKTNAALFKFREDLKNFKG